MQLIIDDDASVANAPAGFQTAVSNAVQILDAMIVDPITVTIDLGYGEDDGSPVTGGTISEAQPAAGIWITYSQLVADLKSNTPDTALFKQNLPATDPNNGGPYFLSTAEEKALGLTSATSTEVDGYVGVGTGFSYSFNQSAGIAAGTYDLTGVLLHEITHALGRYAAPGFTTLLDLMTYDEGTGKLDLTNGVDNKYVSLDSGKTDLVDLNTTSDPSDFAGNTVDPDNAFLSPGTTYKLTTLDTRLMNVLGFDVASAPVSAPPPKAVGASPPGTVIASNGQKIIDASGNTWSMVDGQVAVNGVIDAVTKRVIAMAYGPDGTIWQENADLKWWSKSSPTSNWQSGTPPASIAHPTLVVSANNALLKNGNEVIIDSHLNTWSLNDGGEVWVNGKQIPGTAHATTLAYVNGVVWEQVSGLWRGRSSPTSAWSPPQGQTNSPLTGAPTDPQAAHAQGSATASGSQQSGNDAATPATGSHTHHPHAFKHLFASAGHGMSDTLPPLPRSHQADPAPKTGSSIYTSFETHHPVFAHA